MNIDKSIQRCEISDLPDYKFSLCIVNLILLKIEIIVYFTFFRFLASLWFFIGSIKGSLASSLALLDGKSLIQSFAY